MDKIQMAKGKLARGPLPAMFNSEHYQQVEAFHQTLKQYAPDQFVKAGGKTGDSGDSSER